MWHGVPFACQRHPIFGALRMCWLLPGSFDCFCCPHTSVHRPSIACLAVFLCGPGALFPHALSGPDTICPFPPHSWSAPDGLSLLLRKQPIWAPPARSCHQCRPWLPTLPSPALPPPPVLLRHSRRARAGARPPPRRAAAPHTFDDILRATAAESTPGATKSTPPHGIGLHRVSNPLVGVLCDGEVPPRGAL